MDYKKLLITKEKSLIEAMKQLSETAKKILFVVDEDDRLIGTLTDGDIRRYILKTGRLDVNVEDICNKNPIFAKIGFDRQKIINIAKEKDIKYVPVIDENKRILEILVIEDVQTKVKTIHFRKLDIPVVIMAGGFGRRLDPFTRILPKPLIPIGDKTVLEIIMEKFAEYGADEFWLSVNYKAYIIKSYMSELNLPYQINYIQEDKPLGTAGSLYLLKGKLKSKEFILTNCDTIMDIDYFDLLEHHRNNKNDITIVASVKNYRIPYGVCEVGENGKLLKLTEKPEINFMINTGMYVISCEVLELIPENHFLHATDLIEEAKARNKEIGVYPISENSWIDVGQWEEYKKAVERMKV